MLHETNEVLMPGPTPPKKKWEKTGSPGPSSMKNAIATLQKQTQGLLNFQLVSKLGPQHSPTFVYSVEVNGQRFEGSGRSKKLAKQAAAAAASLQSKKTAEDQQKMGRVTAAASDVKSTPDVCDINPPTETWNIPLPADPPSQNQKQNLEPQMDSKQPVNSKASMEEQVEAMRPVAPDSKLAVRSQLEGERQIPTNRTNKKFAVISQFVKPSVLTDPKVSVVPQKEVKQHMSTDSKIAVRPQLESQPPVSTDIKLTLGPKLEGKLSLFTETKLAVRSQLEGKQQMPTNTKIAVRSHLDKPSVMSNSKVSVVPQMQVEQHVSTDLKFSVVSQPEVKQYVSTDPKVSVVSQADGRLPVSTNPKVSVVSQPEVKQHVSTDPKVSVLSQPEVMQHVSTDPKVSVVSQADGRLPVSTDSNVSVKSQLESKPPVSTDPKVSVVSQPEVKQHVSTNPNVSVVSQPEVKQHVSTDPKFSVLSQPEVKQHVSTDPKVSVVSQPEVKQHVYTDPKVSVVSQPEVKQHVSTDSKVFVVSQPEVKQHVSTDPKFSVVSQPEVKQHVSTDPKVSVVSQPEVKQHVSTDPKVSVVSQPEVKQHVSTDPKVSVVSQPEVKQHVSTDPKVSVVSQPEVKQHVSTDPKVSVVSQAEWRLPVSTDPNVTVKSQLECKPPVSTDIKVIVGPKLEGKSPLFVDTKLAVGPQMKGNLVKSTDNTFVMEGKLQLPANTKVAVPAVGREMDPNPVLVTPKAAEGPQMKGKPLISTDTKATVKQEQCRVLGNAVRAEIQAKMNQMNQQQMQKKAELDRLKEGQELIKACEQARAWLTCGLGHLAKIFLVSADRSVLQRQLEQHEPVYCEMMEKKHEVLQLLKRGWDFLPCYPPQRSAIDKRLKNDLDNIQKDWNTLSKEIMDRNTRLQTCMEHYRKYNRMQDSSLPWLSEAESRLEALKPSSFTKKDIDIYQQLKELKSFRNEVWCHSKEFENTRALGDTFLTACDMDREVMLNELATMKQRWDALNKDVMELIESLEEVARRRTNYNTNLRELQISLIRCEDNLNFHNGCRRISSNPKLLDIMKSLRKETDALKSQLHSLRQETTCLVSLAAGFGVDTNLLQDQVESVAKVLDKLQTRLDDHCSELQSAVAVIAKFNEHLKDLARDLDRLDDELDAMKPAARDVDTIYTQIDDTTRFLRKVSKVAGNVAHAVEASKEIVHTGSASDTKVIREKVELLQRQLGKLKEHARERAGILESTLHRLKCFKQTCKSLVRYIDLTWEQVECSILVDTEEELNKNRELFRTNIEGLTIQVHECNTIGYRLIQSAAVGVNTSSLEETLEKMNRKWKHLKERALYDSNKTMPLPDSTSCDPPTSQVTSTNPSSSVKEPVSSSVPSQNRPSSSVPSWSRPSSSVPSWSKPSSSVPPQSKPVDVIDLSDDDDIVCLGPPPSEQSKKTAMPVGVAGCSRSENQSSVGIEGQAQQPHQDTPVSVMNETTQCNSAERQNSGGIEGQAQQPRQETSAQVISETNECNGSEEQNIELSSDKNLVQQPMLPCQQANESSVPSECNSFVEEYKSLFCDDIDVYEQESQIRICEAWSAQDVDNPLPVPSNIYTYTEDIESNELDVPENILQSLQQELMDAATLHSVDLGEKGDLLQSKAPLDSANSDKSTPVIPTVASASNSATASPEQPNNGDECILKLSSEEMRLIQLLQQRMSLLAGKPSSSVNSESKLSHSDGTVPTVSSRPKRSSTQKAASVVKKPKKDQTNDGLKCKTSSKQNTVSATKRKKEAVPQDNAAVKTKKLSNKETLKQDTAPAAKRKKRDMLPDNPPTVSKRGRPPKPKTLQVKSKEEGSPAPQSSRKTGQQSNTNQQSKLRHKSTVPGKRKSKGSAKWQKENAQCPECKVWYLSDPVGGEWLECVQCKDWIHVRCTPGEECCKECCTDAQCPECKDWFYLEMTDEMWVRCLRCCRWVHKKCMPNDDFCKTCNDGNK